LESHNKVGKSKKKYIIIAISALIAIQLFVSYKAYQLQKENIDEVAPAVYSTLLLPYSNALKYKDFEKAYKDFTTEGYKSKHNYEEFLKAQAENSIHFGNFDSISITSGIFVFMKDLERKWVYRGTANYHTNDMIMQFAVDVVKDTISNSYKISRTYPSQVTIRASAPMIF